MSKLLIVDDEIDLCDLIAELAEDAGLTVRTVNEGNAVEAALAEFQPDAMLLDLMMPGTDGVELLTRLADRLKGVTMALMSGSDARVLNSARRLGSARGLNIITTLEKPLEIATIRTTLTALTQTAPATGSNAPVTAAGLSQAIAERRVQIAVQPIMNNDRQLLGVEVLPRWPQQDGSVLTADCFIDKAKADGLLGQLTQDVVDMALTGLAGLPANATIAFNISPEQLNDPYFESRLLEAATRHNIAPQRLALELAEKPLEAALDDMSKPLASLRARGVQIWLNDYAGAMKIANLMQLPLTGMKLARELVLALPSAEAKATLMGAIALAGARQLPVYGVAVETAEQQAILKELGVTGIQGKIVAMPMSLEDFFSAAHI